MKIQKIALSTPDVPEKLRNIPMPPKQLFVMGSDVKDLLSRPCVTIVGSRKVSLYGRAITTQLTEALSKVGVVIISGLAMGVDSISHAAALDSGGATIAVLPCGLDRIYPAGHRQLARRILEQGGALVTEYAEGAPMYPVNFIARNRITAGLGDVLLITEAGEKSGTLHTARFALEQGKTVVAVPGNITSPTSAGTNNLIKSGATPVTGVDDVLYALGLDPAKAKKTAPRGDTPEEQRLLDLLFAGTTDGTQLLADSGLEASRFNQALTMLELRGYIRPLGANQWQLD